MNSYQKAFLKIHQKSIYATYANSTIFNSSVRKIAEQLESQDIDKVVGIESRGFLLAAAVANKLNCGCIMIRKGGSTNKIDYKPKYELIEEKFVDYSGKEKKLEMENHPLIISKTDNIAIVDDWISTGNQIQAAINIINRSGKGKIKGISVIINSIYNQKTKPSFLKKYNFNYLIKI